MIAGRRCRAARCWFSTAVFPSAAPQARSAPRQDIDEAGADWIGDETVVTCGSSFAGPRAIPTAIADTGKLALRGQDFALKDGLGVARPYQKAGLSNTGICDSQRPASRGRQVRAADSALARPPGPRGPAGKANLRHGRRSDREGRRDRYGRRECDRSRPAGDVVHW